MKKMLTAITFALFATTLVAGPIDGKWKAEAKLESKKKEAVTVTYDLDLKSDGSKLSGSLTNSAGKRGRTLQIEEGKLEGNKFTFVTVQKTRKKGDVRVTWSGMIEGDELKGSHTMGKKKTVDFVAKRQ